MSFHLELLWQLEHSSTATEVERACSVEAGINRDPKKNRMGQDLLEAHMQIHYGVESTLNFDKTACKSCNSARKRPHCDCSQSAISEEMISQSKKAWVEESSKEKEQEDVDIPDGNAELLAEEVKRIDGLKMKLKNRKAFYSPNLMEDVYEKEECKKKKKKNTDHDKPSESSNKTPTVSGSSLSSNTKESKKKKNTDKEKSSESSCKTPSVPGSSKSTKTKENMENQKADKDKAPKSSSNIPGEKCNSAALLGGYRIPKKNNDMGSSSSVKAGSNRPRGNEKDQLFQNRMTPHEHLDYDVECLEHCCFLLCCHVHCFVKDF